MKKFSYALAALATIAIAARGCRGRQADDEKGRHGHASQHAPPSQDDDASQDAHDAPQEDDDEERPYVRSMAPDRGHFSWNGISPFCLTRRAVGLGSDSRVAGISPRVNLPGYFSPVLEFGSFDGLP